MAAGRCSIVYRRPRPPADNNSAAQQPVGTHTCKKIAKHTTQGSPGEGRGACAPRMPAASGHALQHVPDAVHRTP